MTDAQLEHFRTMLLDMQATLQAGAESRDNMGQTVELDQTRTGRLSRMDALQAQAMAKAGAQRAANQARRITTALTRIDAGTFGDCAACEEPIAEARLEADPANPFCLDCAEARQA